MDVRLQANPPHYAVNGGAARSSRSSEDDTLQYLSQEVKESIQFLDDTIISFEESLNEDEQKVAQVTSAAAVDHNVPVSQVDGPAATPVPTQLTASSILDRHLTPKDQDIIDLVRPEPDLVQNKEPVFNPTSPDFQSMVPTPESHFEIKPRRDPVDSLPSEYNPPLPSGSYGPTDSHSSYHPTGCIPTPVLIAQKIAENQSGGTTNILPSSLLRHRSFESEKPSRYSADPPPKQGPPTSAKPTRYPANISFILGHKEHQNQSVANISIEERRAQMLANLSGTSHPLLQADPQQPGDQKPRNIPTRSISFRDPTPDKSRSEALLKLGLNRNRAMSGGSSLLPDSAPVDRLVRGETSAKPPEVTAPTPTENIAKLPEANFPPPPPHIDRKAEIPRTNSFKTQEERNPQPLTPPPAVTETSYYPPPPPEVTSLEFNSYGGKSIIINPAVSSKSETPTSPTSPMSPSSPEPRVLPPALANPSEFNPYGGKTKVMTPAPLTRNDLPDILSSHISKSQTLPAKQEPLPIEPNSYGGRSRIINPSTGVSRHVDVPARTHKALAPTPAPRPARHSYHGVSSSQMLLDHKRRPSSMFRPQGITVKFSGRGPMDDSRREALRKLGLLKES